MKDINFLVDENPFEGEMKKEKKSIPAVKVIVLTLVIAIGILILLAPGLYVRILDGQALSVEQKLSAEKYSEIREVKAQLSQITKKVNGKKTIINAIDAENIPASQVMLITKNALPSGCYLKSLSFNGRSFSISGVAENSFIVSDFLSNMNRLKLFKSNSQGVSLNETQTTVEFSVTYAAQTEGGAQQ